MSSCIDFRPATLTQKTKNKNKILMKKKQLIQAVCKQPVRKLLAALLLLAVAVNLSAADFEGDTLEVRFRLGLSDLDLSYAEGPLRFHA